MKENFWKGNIPGKPENVVNTPVRILDKVSMNPEALEAQLLRSQRLESIGTLAGGISHDLNNVLTPILSGLQILKRKITDQQSLHLLETLEASAKRGTDIVKQVLSFARGLEGEKILLQPRHLIGELEKIIQETFPKSIQFARYVTRELWTVYGDVTQLHQVLLNLCVNARDAMPNGGILTIRADNIIIDENYVRMNAEATSGPHIVITVTDTGTGIPPGIMDKIFEPFFTTKEPGKGTGLGLATVRALVKAHGGFVNVYSEVGKGTSFKVYLPATGTVKGPEMLKQKTDIVSGDGEVILVVDDESSIVEITKESLETYGYRVVTASDGTEAIVQFAEKRETIDLVITDMMMPYMDGPATIRALRKIDPHIKIIATSGLSIDRRVAEAHNLDVQGFVIKPYTADKLLRTVREVLHDGDVRNTEDQSQGEESTRQGTTTNQ